MTAENNGLKAENAELRKERDFYCNQVIENGGRAQRAIDALNDENAKLREELEQWHRLTAGIELPEYPITEFKPKDLERENAKLRELCADMWRGAVTRMDFAERYAFIGEFVDRMRELGVDA